MDTVMRPAAMALAALVALGTVVYGQAAQGDTPGKRRVAVLPFQVNAETGGEAGPEALAAALTDKLNVALVALGRFEVIERARLSDVLAEQALGLSGVVDEATAAQVGKVTGVELVVAAAVNQYTLTAGTTSKGQTYWSARMGLAVRFVDSESGEVKRAAEIDVGAKAEDEAKALYEVTARAVDKIVYEVRFLYPLAATVARVEGKEVYLTLGSFMGMKPGMRFRTVRHGAEITDPATGASLGSEKRQTGVIKITQVEESYSKATVLKDLDGVAVGDGCEEVRATTRWGITAGYGLFAMTSRTAVPDSVPFYGTATFDTVQYRQVAYDGDALPGLNHAVFVGVEATEIANTNLATQLVLTLAPHAGGLAAVMGEWGLSYNFPLVTDRLWLPLGAGFSFGRAWYDYPCTRELESYEFDLYVEYAGAERKVYHTVLGGSAFAGLRLRIAPRLDLYVHGGYRLHGIMRNWEAQYKTSDTDGDGDDKTETFGVDQRYLPHRDIWFRGLDMKAGLTFTF